MMAESGGRHLLGSKGFELYRCTLLGINVPNFKVLTTDCFERYFERPFDHELLKLLKQTLITLGGRVAVRSSSVVEDLSGGSKAGMFRTVLGVDSLEDLVKAVREVWASSDGIDMAVIIQKQLDPEISGVLFTRDPISGGNRTIVEYVDGQCSALVSGKTNPGRIETVNDDSDRSFLTENGTDLKPLMKLSRRLERKFGYPLDIEWACQEKEFFILQVRPITGLPVPKPNGRTYSRVQAEQFYSGPVTPLFHSIFRTIFTRFYIAETLEELNVNIEIDEDFMVRHRNFLYIDTAVIGYAIGLLPPKKVPEGIMSSLPADIREASSSGRRKELFQLVPRLAVSVLRRRERWISRMDENFRNVVVFDILSELGRIGIPEEIDDRELGEAYHKLLEIIRLHVKSSKWGLLLYSIPEMSLTENLLRKNGLERYLPDLISGFNDNRTMDASEDIGYLAFRAGAEPGIKDAIIPDHNDLESYRDIIEKVEGGDRFLEAFDNMLKMYGHRRLSRDIFRPSWKDDPMIPFSMIRQLVIAGDDRVPASMKEKVKEKRDRANGKILRALGFRDRVLFRAVSKHLVRYIQFREYQRFYLDLVLARTKELFSEVSARMVKEGALERQDDIYFLDIWTVEDHLSGKRTMDLKKIAAFNRVSFEDVSGTPGRYLRNGVDFDAVVPRNMKMEVHDGKEFLGQPVSSGEHRGRIKVIKELGNDLRIEKGDILVTGYIDPGQTHLFLMAGALVLEVGGMLSHGAILAREFNIPTVAGIRDATRIFRDSEEAVVDGTRGTVTILN